MSATPPLSASTSSLSRAVSAVVSERILGFRHLHGRLALADALAHVELETRREANERSTYALMRVQ